MIERPVFYEHLNAVENLKMHLAYMQTSGNISEILHQTGLFSVRNKPVSTYSLGMKQRLGLARAMIHHPDLLVLDEPFNGMDPVAVSESIHLLKNVAEGGTAILLSSHRLWEVRQTTDRVGILSGGQICTEISKEDVLWQDVKSMEAFVVDHMRRGGDSYEELV